MVSRVGRGFFASVRAIQSPSSLIQFGKIVLKVFACKTVARYLSPEYSHTASSFLFFGLWLKYMARRNQYRSIRLIAGADADKNIS